MVRAFTHYYGNRAHPLLVFGFIAVILLQRVSYLLL